MNCQFKNFAFVSLVLISLNGCGGKDTNNTVPQAEDPNGGVQQPLPPTRPRVDERLPEWIKRSAPISLLPAGVYTNLELLILAPNQKVVLPIVGDPLIAMDIIDGRSTEVEGNLFLGIEDKKGFAWREWSSLTQMSYRGADVTDAWFRDDEVVVRVTGPVTDGKFKGEINFRIRQSGETQCIPVTKTQCWQEPHCTGPVENGWCYGRVFYVERCESHEEFDVPACQNYMNSSNSSVKKLGKFEVLFSKWLK